MNSAQSLSWPLRAIIFAMIASSFLVHIEPAPTDLIFLLLLGAVALNPRQLDWTGSGTVLWLGVSLFVAGNLVSLLAAETAVPALRYFAITAYLVLAFAILAGLTGRHGKRLVESILDAFVWAAFATAAIGVLARWNLIPGAEQFMRDEHGLRIKSTFKDSNVFAPFLVGGVLVLLNDVLVRRRRIIPAGAMICVMLLGILFAFSRGAFLHLVLSLAAYSTFQLCVIRERRSSTRLVVILGALGIAGSGALFFALASSDLGGFFNQRLAVQDYDSERFAMQAQTLSVAAEYPLGIGPGQWMTPRFFTDPHNVYLRVLAENGLLGLLGWLVWLGSVCVIGLRGVMRRDELSALHATCLAVVLGALAESLFIDTLHWRHLFLFMSLPIGLFVSSKRAELARLGVNSPWDTADESARAASGLRPSAIPQDG